MGRLLASEADFLGVLCSKSESLHVSLKPFLSLLCSLSSWEVLHRLPSTTRDVHGIFPPFSFSPRMYIGTVLPGRLGDLNSTARCLLCRQSGLVSGLPMNTIERLDD